MIVNQKQIKNQRNKVNIRSIAIILIYIVSLAEEPVILGLLLEHLRERSKQNAHLYFAVLN